MIGRLSGEYDVVLVARADGGTLQFTHVPVYVLDVGEGIDGILGTNVLNTAAAVLYDPEGAVRDPAVRRVARLVDLLSPTA